MVPRHVGGLQTDGHGVDLERAVPHDEPLVLRLGQHDEAAALWRLVAMGLTTRTPQLRDA